MIAQSPPRFPFIDFARGVAAVIVAVDHGMGGFTQSTPVDNLVKLGCNGAAAVILFFVISGFCIHLPSSREGFRRDHFLVRRLMRLGAPLISASLVSYSLGFKWFHLPFGSTIVWSLLCEVIYYFAYAVIRPWMKTHRWIVVTAISFLVSLGIAWIGREWIEYPQRPIWQVVLMGLSAWLFGVIIAEFSKSDATLPKMWNVLLWGMVILSGAISTILKFKWDISYGVSLTVISPFYALWIWANLKGQFLLLKRFTWLGAWSYSLYLLHQPLIQSPMIKSLAWGSEHGVLSRFILVLVIMLSTYLFYQLIERPSHQFSRKITS